MSDDGQERPSRARKRSGKVFKDSHHLVLRLMARGLSNEEIISKTGYSYSHINFIRNDDKFKELREHYRSRIAELRDEAERDGYATFVAVREEATGLLLERIMKDPKSIPSPLLADISLRYGDRTGLGMVNKSVNSTVDLNRLAESLALGRARAERLSVVDVTPTRLPSAERPEEVVVSPPRLSSPASE